jgi:proteic killer suppression protein
VTRTALLSSNALQWWEVIQSFQHEGLKLLYERDSGRKLTAAHVPKIRRILTLLDAAESPADLALPGLGLHPLKGSRKGEWAVSVSGNWRITFKWNGGPTDVNLEDYH